MRDTPIRATPLKPRRSTHRSPARFLGRVVDGARAAAFPGFIPFCKATERARPPAGDDWIHEITHAGCRLQAHVHGGDVGLFTSDRHDWTDRMPAIAASVHALPVNTIVLDGELAAVDVQGRPAAFELPAVDKKTRVRGRLIFYAFDLLYLDGFDLRDAALIDRKRVLEALLDNTRGTQLVKYVEHIAGDGPLVLAHACKLHLDGIVSKAAASAYRSGRCSAWVKTKCAVMKDES